jgi:hypothetical protein
VLSGPSFSISLAALAFFFAFLRAWLLALMRIAQSAAQRLWREPVGRRAVIRPTGPPANWSNGPAHPRLRLRKHKMNIKNSAGTHRRSAGTHRHCSARVRVGERAVDADRHVVAPAVTALGRSSESVRVANSDQGLWSGGSLHRWPCYQSAIKGWRPSCRSRCLHDGRLKKIFKKHYGRPRLSKVDGSWV